MTALTPTISRGFRVRRFIKTAIKPTLTKNLPLFYREGRRSQVLSAQGLHETPAHRASDEIRISSRPKTLTPKFGLIRGHQKMRHPIHDGLANCERRYAACPLRDCGIPQPVKTETASGGLTRPRRTLVVVLSSTTVQHKRAHSAKGYCPADVCPLKVRSSILPQ